MKSNSNYRNDTKSVTHTHTNTNTVHMALMGYFIVFSFVTKPGQTLEFLLWGTIVPLNFLAGYYCSIVASTPQPTVYAFTNTHLTPDSCAHTSQPELSPNQAIKVEFSSLLEKFEFRGGLCLKNLKYTFDFYSSLIFSCTSPSLQFLIFFSLLLTILTFSKPLIVSICDCAALLQNYHLGYNEMNVT